jgi:hypothetical protein
MYSIGSICWVPNGYGYPPGMGMGRALYPWVRVHVEFCTHQLYGYVYCIALPCPYPAHCHPYWLASVCGYSLGLLHDPIVDPYSLINMIHT